MGDVNTTTQDNQSNSGDNTSSLGELSREDLEKEIAAARAELEEIKNSGELDSMKSELDSLRAEIAAMKSAREREKDEALTKVLTGNDNTSAEADTFESSLMALAGGRVRKDKGGK